MATRTKKQTKKARRDRVYVHPEVEPLVWSGGAIAPGDEIPANVPDSQLRIWLSAHLIVGAPMYKLYWSRVWNRKYPKDQVPPGYDVEPDTGDASADGVKEV